MAAARPGAPCVPALPSSAKAAAALSAGAFPGSHFSPRSCSAPLTSRTLILTPGVTPPGRAKKRPRHWQMLLEAPTCPTTLVAESSPRLSQTQVVALALRAAAGPRLRLLLQAEASRLSAGAVASLCLGAGGGRGDRPL